MKLGELCTEPQSPTDKVQSHQTDGEITRSTSSGSCSGYDSPSRAKQSSKLRESWYAQVKSKLEVPQSNHSWHVLLATEKWEADALQIPDLITAVVIVTDMASLSSSMEIIRSLKAKGFSLPVVVMLMGEGGQLEDPATALSVYHGHFAAGADDVVMQVGMMPGPVLTVSTSLLRIEAQQKVAAKLEETIRDRYQEEFEQRVDELEEQGIEPRKGMFWQSISKIFKELPPLQPEVTETPEMGTEIACCRISHLLGKGSCGDVYSATNLKTGEEEAVKVISKDKLCELKYVEDLRKEVRVLRALKNKHVVVCHGVLHGPGHLFLRLEKVGTCNLNRALKVAGGSFHVDAARNLHQQIISGLAYCHTKGVAHRDVKPENVGISDCGSQVKLLDFGSAAPIGSVCNDMAGTMPFMAPEILAAEDRAPYDPSRCDVWSAGVVLLEMLCGWGTLNRMLQWPEQVAPKRARVKELGEYLSEPKALRSYLKTDLCSVEEDLVVLLDGMLRVELTCRWSAAQVWESSWLQKCFVDSPGQQTLQ